jgi:hypothetical protein
MGCRLKRDVNVLVRIGLLSSYFLVHRNTQMFLFKGGDSFMLKYVHAIGSIYNIGKVVSILTLCVLAFLFLCSCNSTDALLPPPPFTDDGGAIPPSQAITANIYFQNTESMLGFINVEVENVLMSAMDSIQHSLSQFLSEESKGYNLYYLDNEKKASLSDRYVQWEDKGDQWDYYKIKDNYLTDYNQKPIKLDDGPMKMLADDDNPYKLDRDALSVVITNLVEHNNRLRTIGAYIYKNIISNDGYHATLFAIRAPFKGSFNSVDPRVLSTSTSGNDIHRDDTGNTVIYPLVYVLVMGPDSDVDAFALNFSARMSKFDVAYYPNEKFLNVISRTGFTRTDIFASGGIKNYSIDYNVRELSSTAVNDANKHNNVIVAPAAFSNDRKMLQAYLTPDNSNLTINMQLKDFKSYIDHSETSMFVFEHHLLYNEQPFKNLSQINFSIPLEFSQFVNEESLLKALENGNKIVTADTGAASIYTWVQTSEKILQWKELEQTVSEPILRNLDIQCLIRNPSGVMIRGMDRALPPRNDNDRSDAYDDLNIAILEEKNNCILSNKPASI